MRPTFPYGPVTTTGLLNINDVTPAIDLSKGVECSVIYLYGSGTVSGGTLYLEEAPATDYAGTWSPIGSSIAASSLNGACLAIHVRGSVIAYRARVSSAITGGGSISAKVMAS
jgi:hypothetical protein